MALQMTWQQQQPNKRKINRPPLGLKNLGNSCYLNSVLQCLTYTPPLANFCLKSKHTSVCDLASADRDRKSDCPFCILERRIVRSLCSDLTLDAPYKLTNCLRLFAEHFRLGRQEDAHEFLRYVIDACHNTCLRLKKLQHHRRKAVVNGGKASQVKCLSCGKESNKVDEIMDISLDVMHSSSLKEALHKFFQAEVLDGNNKYKCDNCKKLVSAKKQMSILQAPNVLVIQLKRFEGIFGGKIDKAIAFEEVLVLSSYMCKASQDPHPEYNLFASIVHSGFSPDSGHYYAYIKDAMNRWYCCNDSFISLSTLKEVLSEKVYILFFSRTKQRPVTTSTDSTTNGMKCNGINGNGTSKVLETGPHKVVSMKQAGDHSFDEDKTTLSKVDNMPSSPKMLAKNNGRSNVKQISTSVNSVKLVFNKKESSEKNGDVKASNFKKQTEINGLPVKDTNGISKSSETVTDGERSHLVLLSNGKDSIQSISNDSSAMKSRSPNHQFSGNGSISSLAPTLALNPKLKEENSCTLSAEDARSNLDNEKLSSNEENGESCNFVAKDGQIHLKLDKMSSKRKLQPEDSCISFAEGDKSCAKPGESNSKSELQGNDMCILLADDADSRRKLQELKETLEKEASQVLRSCGWSDDVHDFMRSKGYIEAGNESLSRSYKKRSLIEEARKKFAPRIPEEAILRPLNDMGLGVISVILNDGRSMVIYSVR
ncbi:Ubiquitin carboxyl-terminal hydrolase [Heracleum sosnowskyi]|uniref:ubiquitinyl hydrolase 1 n=1 Tax=Heracleum sosnowskyi TaxID=360622 RepID=A0AAD8H8C1_9APIA|nr:Ubiquitin carboxyl-terminal hydrolase [Heracleum sosnowskyi]